MSRTLFFIAACTTLLVSCTVTSPKPNLAELQKQVMETERAFANTMTDRDHKALKAFLSDEANFFSEPELLRGKQQVADWWKRYYEEPDAPFSWEPEHVEVLDSGTLALSTGPVRDPEGNLIGTFTSVWRLDAPGIWRVIFDK